VFLPIPDEVRPSATTQGVRSGGPVEEVVARTAVYDVGLPRPLLP